MKFIKKHIFKIFSILLILAISTYTICFGIGALSNMEIYNKSTPNTKIYEIWHIETFEGGGKARIDYLKAIARSMEKKYNGVLFMVKSIRPDSLKTSLSCSSPDIISFGYGVGAEILPHLVPFDRTYNVRDELIESGSFDNKLYAIPYIMSGYALFSHSADYQEFHCGQNGYNNPKMIYSTLDLSPKIIEDQYDAYKSFVYDKKVRLLGTARDLYRINNLNNIGRTNAMITPIDSYTDLIQYISVCRRDSIIDEFINEIFTIENQTTLTEYSLFSSLNIKLYQLDIYNDMENAILNAKIPKVF